MSNILTPCIEWRGAKNTNGYGWRAFKGTQMSASRAAWIEAFGDTGGLCVLHKCDNRVCVSLDHLFLGTHADNMKDKTAKGRHHNQTKTHCIRGHPLSGENLYIFPNGSRGCRACRVIHPSYIERHTKKERHLC